MKYTFTLIISLMTSIGVIQAQLIDLANDVAYSAGWNPGTNGGSGFGPWAINVPGNSSNGGVFIGNSNISVDDKSWGLYSNEGLSEAIRPFTNPPITNDRISIKMDNGFVSIPGGSVGFGIQNASNENLLEVYFKQGDLEYTVSDAAGPMFTGVSFTDLGLLIEIELTSMTTYDLKITDLNSNITTTLTSRNLMAPGGGQGIHQFRLFNFEAGAGPTHNLYFNEVSHQVGALPITLSSFDATKRTEAVELNWTTLSEENNEGFYIERAPNRTDFEQIHFEKGNGNTFEQVDYSFTDERPFDGVNYYRLKQIDFDGSFEYSDIVSVDFKEQATIKLFPNPSSDKLTISGDFSELVTLKIIDLNGKVLHQSEQFFAEQADINLDTIPSGSYILQVISEDNQSTLSAMSFVKR